MQLSRLDIIKHKGLSSTAKLVYLCLAEGVAPSPSLLAKHLGICRQSAAKALKELTCVKEINNQLEGDVKEVNVDMLRKLTHVNIINTSRDEDVNKINIGASDVKKVNIPPKHFSTAYNVLDISLKDNINTKEQNITKELSTADVNNILAFKETEVSKEKEVLKENLTKEKVKEKEKAGHVSSLCFEVVRYLNERLATNYRPAALGTCKLVAARENEGFGLDDFKAVIDTKAADWLHDDRMRLFLRPETLFSNKFEGYLNQARLPKPRVRGSPKTQGNWALLEELFIKYDEEERLENEQKRQEAVRGNTGRDS